MRYNRANWFKPRHVRLDAELATDDAVIAVILLVMIFSHMDR